MIFFPGIHQPCDARHLPTAFISVNRLRTRKGPFAAGDWILDSGAFSTIAKHGCYPEDSDTYSSEIQYWGNNGSGNLLAAVAQDWMCEDEQLARTGARVGDGSPLAVHHHQVFTLVRYECLLMQNCGGVYIMPVLQGRSYGDYRNHIDMYEANGHLPHGAWVGVGSICKRNRDPMAIYMILTLILDKRPDLKLHGFGLKTTALELKEIRDMLYSADSMAWSYAARREGRNQNDWHEAKRFADKINQGVS